MTIRIVLVGTTHPGNIGATARAMKNMGLRDLVLVAPRSFPHEEASARASGAEDLLDGARVAATLEEAVADCVWVAGASARQRSIAWPELSAREAADKAMAESAAGPVALVFGPEKSGLSNDDLARCQALLYIPTAPDFSSLNLAMAVQVVTYEVQMQRASVREPPPREVRPATAGEMEHFYGHLEELLLASRFLDPDNPRHLMRRLRRLFARAEPDRNEINILRGILASLAPAERTREHD
ncbi:MAG TPA: RNA methyltransferase [Woeseiaceae bacterium]|nr:RNA methyltransferase [Woeseiaceae bacterium]